MFLKPSYSTAFSKTITTANRKHGHLRHLPWSTLRARHPSAVDSECVADGEVFARRCRDTQWNWSWTNGWSLQWTSPSGSFTTWVVRTLWISRVDSTEGEPQVADFFVLSVFWAAGKRCHQRSGAQGRKLKGEGSNHSNHLPHLSRWTAILSHVGYNPRQLFQTWKTYQGCRGCWCANWLHLQRAAATESPEPPHRVSTGPP